jgi:large subunit ribosomal protein L14e
VSAAVAVAADVAGKFAASAWGKKLASRQTKAAQNDFERYQAAVAKAKRNRAVRKAYNQLAKSA